MLEIAEPDDARAAMGRAVVVAGRMALEAQHALAAPREMMDRRAAHRAQATDDDVKGLHSASNRRPKQGLGLSRAAIKPQLLRPRPAEAASGPVQAQESSLPLEPAPPSACRLRLTSELAVAPSLPALN